MRLQMATVSSVAGSSVPRSRTNAQVEPGPVHGADQLVPAGQVVLPSAFDPGRVGVVVLLHGRERRVAPVQ